MVLSQTFMVLLVGHGSMGMSPLLFMVCCWKDVFNWQHTTQVMLGRSNEGDFNNQPSLLSQYSNILTVCWGPFIICCWLSNDLTVYLVAKNIHKIVASIPFWGVEEYQFKPHRFGFLWEYDTSKWSSFSSSFRNEHALFGLYQTPYQYIYILTLPPKVGIFSISSFLLGDGGLRYIYIYHQHISCPHEMVNFNMNLYLNYSELALVGA